MPISDLDIALNIFYSFTGDLGRPWLPEDGDVAVGVLERSISVGNDKRNLEFLEKLQLGHQHLPETVHSEMVLRVLNIVRMELDGEGTFWKPPIQLSMGVYSGLQV